MRQIFKKKKIRAFFTCTILLIIGILVYEFLWGKLFPFSPVIIGFSKYELPEATVYIQNGAKYKDFTGLDSLIRQVEKFHEWKFLHNPKIFLFRDNESYWHRSFTKGLFVTYYDRIFVTPTAISEVSEGKISMNIFLLHELSHSLIHQHLGLTKFNKFPKWLIEGVAVYSANQMGTSIYPGKQETYKLIKQGYFLPPEIFRTNEEKKFNLNLENKIGFLYSEFACIVDYMIDSFGKEKFIVYLKQLCDNPDNDEVFKNVYGIDFETFIYNFRNNVDSE
jgi:hypothetical protein